MTTLNKTKSETEVKNYNIDLTKRVIIHTAKETFINSSIDGINNIILEKEGTISGRTTAIVEYKSGKKPQHQTRSSGEEIFVLEGIFSDENGNYSAGTYIRNPSGYLSTPFSKNGCKLFIKSNQMNANDSERVVIDSNTKNWNPGYGELKVNSLTENAALVKWPKGAHFLNHSHFGGEEIFVLSGEFIDEHGRYPKGTWIRSPHLSTHDPYVEEETIILVKTGHLFSNRN